MVWCIELFVLKEKTIPLPYFQKTCSRTKYRIRSREMHIEMLYKTFGTADEWGVWVVLSPLSLILLVLIIISMMLQLIRMFIQVMFAF